MKIIGAALLMTTALAAPCTVQAATKYYTVTIVDGKNTSKTSDDTKYKVKVKSGSKLSSTQISNINKWVDSTSYETFTKMRYTNTGAASKYYYSYRRSLPSSLKSAKITKNTTVKVKYTRRYVEDYVRLAYYMSKDKRVGYQTPNGRNFQLNSSGYKWNVDCASFVFYALYYTGYLNGSPRDPFGTDEETAVLKANGFVEVSLSSRKRGDILLVKRNERNTGYGHTAIYIGENLLIDAATNYDGKAGDSSGKEVAIRYYTEGKYKHCFRLADTSKVDAPGSTPYALLSTQSARQSTIGT